MGAVDQDVAVLQNLCELRQQALPVRSHRLRRHTVVHHRQLVPVNAVLRQMVRQIFGAQAPTSGTPGGNPAQLAHGISIALYNTAFGLIVAIPTLIFWRYFRARVDGYLLTLELASEQLVRHLVNLRK